MSEQAQLQLARLELNSGIAFRADEPAVQLDKAAHPYTIGERTRALKEQPGAPLKAEKIKLNFVPVISWASAGAVHDYSDMADQIDQRVETISSDKDAFALILEGDSMMPRFEAGDIVIFEPNSEPRNGDFVVAKLADSNGILFKKYRRTGPEGKIIRLESMNPDYKSVEHPRTAFSYIFPAVEFKSRIRRN